MHIEPGVLAAGTIAVANVVALAVLGATASALLRRPQLLLRASLAAAFFTACTQACHMQVGPSELHFLGAMPMYLALGPAPTLLGFALGLLAQGLIFEPADLLHLSINTLTLAVPLLAVHVGLGRRIDRVNLRAVLRLDAAYYAGVATMVGFWLAIGEVATPLADWARFAVSYLVVVALEPVLTIAVLLGVARLRSRRWAATLFDSRFAVSVR